MTASLPEDVQSVFDRFLTTEYTTLDAGGRPLTWPVTPYYRPGQETIDVTTGLGYPKKANDARANPRVALLFSDPTGSGLGGAPMVLVQGSARVDDADLAANRDRYARESAEKLPAATRMLPPKPVQRLAAWYFLRIYVRVRPERVFVWPGGDATAEPDLLDARLDEVRSGHEEEGAAPAPRPSDAEPVWHPRLDELGGRLPAAVLSLVAPDGFPFSVRVPVAPDRSRRLIRIAGPAAGAPLAGGPACLTAHDHAEDFTWQRNFQVRGELVSDGAGWALAPQRLVGGFELPPGSALSKLRVNARKMRRFRRIAKRELAAIESRRR